MEETMLLRIRWLLRMQLKIFPSKKHNMNSNDDRILLVQIILKYVK